MIVGTKVINEKELLKALNSNRLLEFCNNLIPKYAQHINAVQKNQRYLVALNLRKISNVPYIKKAQALDTLLSGVKITGELSQLFTIDEMVEHCSMQDLLFGIFNEELRDGT